MPISKERLAEIEAIQDENIDCTDIPEAGPDFWANAKPRMPQATQGVYLNLDSDILEWIKAQGPGYQAKINAILRIYMERTTT